MEKRDVPEDETVEARDEVDIRCSIFLGDILTFIIPE